jgi:soluble lytic murein transglycosylase
MPGSFQLLASTFRANPELLTRTTLSLMYPKFQLEAVRESSLDLDPFLVLSLIRQESAFDEKAKSSANAYGLMQLQLPTARTFEKVAKNQLYDPKTNVRIGSKYFTHLLTRYSGEVGLALAAYNAGPERIKGWVRRYPMDNRLLFFDLIPVRETRDYVSSIVRNYYWYLRLYAAKNQEFKSVVQRIYWLSRPSLGQTQTLRLNGPSVPAPLIDLQQNSD